jgi:hypothetical protein
VTEPAHNDEDLRFEIYRSFATTGCAPAIDDAAALARLAQQRHVVLDGAGNIVLAHPFSSIPMGFSVMGRHTLWWGGCAWDSFALPHLLPDEPRVLVATVCPACDRALAWNVGRDAPPAGQEVAHFLVPAREMWNDVVHTCGHQRLFCSERCVDAWLVRTGHPRGYVLDLGTLWRLARHWYDGRLERGYRRREPAEAKAYFRDVGLRGEFWGL